MCVVVNDDNIYYVYESKKYTVKRNVCCHNKKKITKKMHVQ